MKLLRVVLAGCVLCLGCHSLEPIGRGEFASDDETAYFYLHDGSCIKSQAGDHQRKEGGYSVKGVFVLGQFCHEEIEGVYCDSDISDIEIEKVSATYTVTGIVLGGVLCIFFVGAAVFSGWRSTFSGW